MCHMTLWTLLTLLTISTLLTFLTLSRVSTVWTMSAVSTVSTMSTMSHMEAEGRRLLEVRLPKMRFWKNIAFKTNRKRGTAITTIGLVTRGTEV